MSCLDTSVIIGILKGDLRIRDFVVSHSKNGMVSTTSITEYELLRHSDMIKKDAAQQLLSKLAIYPFDSKAASKAAAIYAYLKGKGTMINENDIMIAAIALANGEALITKDKDFEQINSGGIMIV
jgi:predicted nucleic acid-binding protein